MSKSTQIAEEVISSFNKTITDEIFIRIQEDRDFMRRYLEAVQEEGLDNVNKSIGKAVKAAYNLTDLEEDGREDYPISTLIKSHQRFK